MVDEVHSVEQLLGISFRSLADSRTHLTLEANETLEFEPEGLVRLASLDFLADKSTASDQFRRHTGSLELEWLQALVIEVDQIEDDKREDCAQM